MLLLGGLGLACAAELTLEPSDLNLTDNGETFAIPAVQQPRGRADDCSFLRLGGDLTAFLDRECDSYVTSGFLSWPKAAGAWSAPSIELWPQLPTTTSPVVNVQADKIAPADHQAVGSGSLHSKHLREITDIADLAGIDLSGNASQCFKGGGSWSLCPTGSGNATTFAVADGNLPGASIGKFDTSRPTGEVRHKEICGVGVFRPAADVERELHCQAHDRRQPALAGKHHRDVLERHAIHSAPVLMSGPPSPTAPSDAVRYVDTTGDDGNDGKSPATAWATVERVNNTALGPGSVVRFRAGQIWFNSTLIPPSDGVTFARYGTGIDPIIFAGPNLKSATWTHESDVGPNVWSTTVQRDAGAANNASYKLFLNGVWLHSAHAKSNAQGGPSALAQDGDFHHVVGAGPRKLYIYNSGGNPATDPNLVSLAYGLRTHALALFDRTGVGVQNIEFRGGRIGIIGNGSDDITLTDVIVSGTARHGVQVRNGGHYIFNRCSVYDAGVNSSPEGGGNKGGHGILMGGEGVAQADLLELNGCKVGEGFIGEDAIATSAGRGLRDGTVIIRGGRYINATGENAVDLKRGSFLAREGAVFRGSSRAGGGNETITVHVFAEDTVIEDSELVSDNSATTIIVNSAPNNAAGVRVVFRRNLIVSNANPPGGPSRKTIWLKERAGDNSIFENNTIRGPITGGAASTCLLSEGGANHRIADNVFDARHPNLSHMRLVGATQNAVVSGNTTPDAGGLRIQAVPGAIAHSSGN
jgi:hypothetical protein